MKIIVDKEKLTLYLLNPRNRNDKSKFLNRLGFDKNNWQLLQKAIMKIFLQNQPDSTEKNQYGIIYNVSGILDGLNGNSLNVKTIWIKLNSSNLIRFVTLFPNKENNEI